MSGTYANEDQPPGLPTERSSSEGPISEDRKVEAAANNASMRRIREAQARAEIEIITSITESILVLQVAGDADLSDIVTIRVVEAMREAAEDEQVKAMVPGQALSMLNDLQALLQNWGEVP